MHIQRWAGGVCCSYGTNITVTFTVPLGFWQRFDSVEACTRRGEHVIAWSWIPRYETADHALVYTVTYSYYYENRISAREWENPVEFKNTCVGYDIGLVKNGQRIPLKITKTTESMLAYP